MEDLNQQQQLQQAKDEVRRIIQETQTSPDVVINLGNMAEAALKDAPLYGVFRSQAINSGLADEEDLPPQMNPSILGIFAALGKMTSQMAQAGELVA